MGVRNTNHCPRVLFIGNRYTAVNDLPGMLAALAKAGGRSIQIVMDAPGSFSIAQHLNSPHTLEALQSSRWDFAVLQEQSQIPALEQTRSQEVYPAARALVQKIWQAGGQSIFFLNWAQLIERGSARLCFAPDFSASQSIPSVRQARRNLITLNARMKRIFLLRKFNLMYPWKIFSILKGLLPQFFFQLFLHPRPFAIDNAVVH